MGCGGHKTYSCSPPISAHTKAILTYNNFEKGGDGGDPSECDGKFHSDHDLVVALSTGWYNGGSRCKKKIRIMHKGKSVEATVVDETGRAWRRWWWTSATQCKVARTTSSTARRRYGTLWAWPRMKGKFQLLGPWPSLWSSWISSDFEDLRPYGFLSLGF
ncbi:unnamed protein product [Linum tenue]|uniref:Uncharacterized protein n=1 Tax=Linum tenue TaxID=586396 RepID=A0AAV0N3H6_9ROSI|nr:unnamed protein product [Linum tenue]